MKSRISGLSVVVACCGQLIGCGSSEQERDSERSVSQGLMGNVSTVGCTTAETAHYERLFRYGAQLARSSAALECLIESTVNGVGSGPYENCAGVDDGDPLPGEPLTAQSARIVSAAVSRLDTEVRCNQSCPGGRACADDISFGQGERIKWTARGEPPTDDPGDDDYADLRNDVALAWHEVMHNLGYEHDGNGQTCGLVAGAPAPAMVGACIKSVGSAAGQSPVCAAMTCASGERALPKRISAFGPSDPCECVPEVFMNENESGDRFGSAFASGDFDGDGYDDLAVGAPWENGETGVVYVFRGSLYGPRFWKRLRQQDFTVVDHVTGTTPYTPTNVNGDEVGYALGAGDLNNDGYADLLIGAPGKNSASGGLYILPGSNIGPDTAHGQWVDTQDSGEGLFPDTRFGTSIAVGNFDADAYKDFAVGVPYWTSSAARTGAVALHRGRSVGIGAGRFQVSDGLLNHTTASTATADDHFGWSIAVGNVDSDTRDELIVGAPGRNSGSGEVFRLDKSTSGWGFGWSLRRPGAVGFGEVVAVGDFMGDEVGDLAVGAPHDVSKKGSVFVYLGDPATNSGFTYAQTLSGATDDDYFGAGLAIGNVANGSKGELVVGAPNRYNSVFGRIGGVYYYAGTTGTTLGSATITFTAMPDGGPSDTVIPTDFGGGWLGDPVALLRLPGDTRKSIVAGSVLNVIGGVESGAAYIIRGGAAAWKLDQETMRHGSAFPY